MNLKDIKIGLRLGLGFGSILILTVVLVALGLFNIQKVQGLLFRVVNGDVKKLELAEDMKEAIQEEAVDLRNVLLLTDRARKEKNAEEIKLARVKFNELLSELEKQCTSSDADVIKDIADQTNPLALNAAIEAARAGEQGKGFAVVADKVRKLAEKTTKATTEIGGMIKTIQEETNGAVSAMDESLQKVGTGVALSKEAGNALLNRVDSVNSLQSMVQQIASATEEMSTVSEQISGDIDVVANVSKETAPASDQIAQASQDLAGLSMDLKGIVSQFRLE